MKTDKFEESIRKKLEDIDPPFRENDWLQLRSFLRRNGVPSLGGTATQWLMPMLSAASVAGLLMLTVWQYRTNQQLEQTVQTLKDSVDVLQQVPAEVAADSPTAVQPRVDTVYITREVIKPVPGVSPDAPRYRSDSEEETLANRLDLDVTSEKAEDRSENEEVTTESETGVSLPVGSNRKKTNVLSRPDSRERLTESNRRTDLNRPDRNTTPSGTVNQSRNSYETDSYRSTATTERGNRRYAGRQKPSGYATNPSYASESSGENRTSGSGTANPPAHLAAPTTLSWEPVRLRSQALSFDSSYYEEGYQRRIRRIRPFYPASSTPVLAAKPVVEEPQPRFQFRLGVGGQVAGSQTGYGIAGEMLVGKHLVVSAGLNYIKLAGGDFLSDIDYLKKRQIDFRKEFPDKVPADPFVKVINISQDARSWQVPLTVGYRLPIGNSISVLPMVGASLSLSTLEKITFEHRKPPMFYETDRKSIYRDCDPKLYHSWLVSLGVEKQVGHWAVQISPFVSTPVTSSRISLNETTAGFRGRLLYQF
ncbi:hypothetical protein ACO2Q8_28960 [Larkinella sp. VNQ87]|uniref:hypothetical protein n=1 Tax=Larkinella sp. VNQ87 TaxID=3400921 RepID=UPI003C07D4DA